MLFDAMGFLCLIAGLISAAWLAYYPLRNRKLMPKKWAIVAIVVGLSSQIINQVLQSRQQSDLKTALEKSQVAVSEQTSQLKDQGQKLAESQSLIKRLSVDVKNQ